MKLVPAVIGPGTTTDDRYVVDLDTGDIYRKKTMRKLKPSAQAAFNGEKFPYHRVQLGTVNGKRAIARPWHRVVLASSIGEMPSSKINVRHLDGNPTNNHPNNLCFGTAGENAADKKLHAQGLIATP